MPVDPVISVCIANYNGIGLIDECIRSVLEQDGAPPVEIIVHDDASPDGSAAYIRERYPEVVLIESTENVGYCVSNNRMVARARGEYVLLLNNDAALFPDALATLHRAAADIGMPCILGLPQHDWTTGRLIDRGSLLDPFLNAVPNLDPQRPEVGMVPGACLWLPKALWSTLGGFPDWFGSIAEDLYLCCRARLLGYSVRVLAHSGFRHRVGASLGGGKAIADQLVTTFRRRCLSERNKSYALVVCIPAPAILVLLPLHLLLIPFEGLVLSLLQRDSRFWTRIYGPCLSALWRERMRLRRERNSAQASRKPGAAFFSAFVVMPYKLAMLLRHGLPKLT